MEMLNRDIPSTIGNIPKLEGRLNESGRIRQFDIKRTRYQNSFLPKAVTIFNEEHSRDSSQNQ